MGWRVVSFSADITTRIIAIIETPTSRFPSLCDQTVYPGRHAFRGSTRTCRSIQHLGACTANTSILDDAIRESIVIQIGLGGDHASAGRNT